jgi:hypothetical protein
VNLHQTFLVGFFRIHAQNHAFKVFFFKYIFSHWTFGKQSSNRLQTPWNYSCKSESLLGS